MNNLTANISITSRAVNAFNSLEDEFASLYSKRDFKNMIKTLKRVKDVSALRVSFLPELYEMFNECGIDYQKNQDLSYYEQLIDEKMDEERYGAQSIEDRMVLALFDMYENYTEPVAYMERIVSRLMKDEDADKWAESSLRLRILKQFVKYGNYLDDAGYSGRTYIQKSLKEKYGKNKLGQGEDADLIDETIFCMIDDPDTTADNIKHKYSLMKLADDLANGKFRTNGATKKGLYLFAMVYDMTLPGFPGANENTDIIKNLFRDYYNNNLLAYLNEGYRNHLREYETDPSGQGVNYKNFAEMIFLYYIVQDIGPVEKIKKSYDMISKVTDTAKMEGFKKKTDSSAERNTKFYKGKFLKEDRKDNEVIFSENIFKKDEDEFMKFLLDNYECDVRTGRTHVSRGRRIEETIAPLQMDIDQNTAYARYQEIMAMLNSELVKSDMTVADCNYGLWFDDVYSKYGSEEYADKYNGIDKERYENFIEVLIGANNFVGNNVDEKESDRSEESEKKETSRIIIKALSVSSAREVTRTSLMVAFYYYFNCREEDMTWTSYRALYEVFKEELDEYLLDAGYQEVSAKNIFDVLLTFSSYARTL